MRRSVESFASALRGMQLSDEEYTYCRGVIEAGRTPPAHESPAVAITAEVGSTRPSPVEVRLRCLEAALRLSVTATGAMEVANEFEHWVRAGGKVHAEMPTSLP